MSETKFKIGDEVVRTKGDYVVGRIGKVVSIDSDKGRAQVEWRGETKTWVSFGSLELRSIPYEIIPTTRDKKTGRTVWQKYVMKLEAKATS